MTRRPAVGALAIAAAAAAGTVAFLAGTIYGYGETEFDGTADAAIVLGAAAWGDEPSPVLRERIEHAIALYRESRVDKVILTGGRSEGAPSADASVARAYARRRGLPPEDVLVETSSRTTRENLAFARQVGAQAGLASFAIVSDPLHLKRALTIARDLGLDAEPAPTPTSRYRSAGSRLRLLARETSFYVDYLLTG